MKLVIILFALYAFLESVSYGLYEYQTKENKVRRRNNLHFCHTSDSSFRYLVY